MSTECDRICEELVAYADGALSVPKNAYVKSHLAACPSCADHLSSLTTLERLLDDVAAQPVVLRTSMSTADCASFVRSRVARVDLDQDRWTCERVEPELVAYIDGELGEGAERRIAVHLATCAPCEAQWSDLNAVGGLLELDYVRAAPDHSARIIDYARQVRRARILPWRGAQKTLLRLAAVLLLALSVGVLTKIWSQFKERDSQAEAIAMLDSIPEWAESTTPDTTYTALSEDDVQSLLGNDPPSVIATQVEPTGDADFDKVVAQLDILENLEAIETLELLEALEELDNPAWQLVDTERG